MWYARHCTAEVIKVDFIGIESAEKASAENIISGLSEIVSANLQLEWPSFIEKTVAISCDGASVMVGCRNGIGAILRRDQPSLITIHCMAHRLE